jgi:peroxiredoxin Q/BCP
MVIAVPVVVIVVIGVLFGVYQGSRTQQPAGTGGSGYAHVAGQPGIGAPAPAFTLAATTGGQVGLAQFRGRTVLLFFQEGVDCQPCWDQIKDLERSHAAVTNARIDAVVSITTDPIDLLTQKVHDEHLSTPVLSDPTVAVSTSYSANQYGMMGTALDGHSFVLVGPDGRIQWRADYGGAPDYTMYLPTQKLLADLTRERRS